MAPADDALAHRAAMALLGTGIVWPSEEPRDRCLPVRLAAGSPTEIVMAFVTEAAVRGLDVPPLRCDRPSTAYRQVAINVGATLADVAAALGQRPHLEYGYGPLDTRLVFVDLDGEPGADGS